MFYEVNWEAEQAGLLGNEREGFIQNLGYIHDFKVLGDDFFDERSDHPMPWMLPNAMNLFTIR